MAMLAQLPPYVVGLLIVLFIVISAMMMLVVLVQRPSGGGLSGAFGSAADGAGQTAFGARTGDALTIATIVIFVLFLGTAVGLNYAVTKTAAPPTAEMIAPPTESDVPADADATPEGDAEGVFVPGAPGAEVGDPATDGGDSPLPDGDG